jgi:hypothetical protein
VVVSAAVAARRRESRSTTMLMWGRAPLVSGSRSVSRGAAGEFGEGVGAALRGGPVVVGAGGFGQGVDGGQHGLAGLGVQQPVDAEHPGPGGRHVQAAAVVAAFALLVLPLGVQRVAQVRA